MSFSFLPFFSPLFLFPFILSFQSFPYLSLYLLFHLPVLYITLPTIKKQNTHTSPCVRKKATIDYFVARLHFSEQVSMFGSHPWPTRRMQVEASRVKETVLITQDGGEGEMNVEKGRRGRQKKAAETAVWEALSINSAAMTVRDRAGNTRLIQLAVSLYWTTLRELERRAADSLITPSTSSGLRQLCKRPSYCQELSPDSCPCITRREFFRGLLWGSATIPGIEGYDDTRTRSH